ncbi:MAG: hypothetical protein HY268_03875 [Deltaproteobacteria bacterium]|nr:hypothetical protein [Deltaproteobacteria bacterium]
MVSDSALVAGIGELRRALGDARRTPQFIETVHGRGSRFIAPVATTELNQNTRHSYTLQRDHPVLSF